MGNQWKFNGIPFGFNKHLVFHPRVNVVPYKNFPFDWITRFIETAHHFCTGFIHPATRPRLLNFLRVPILCTFTEVKLVFDRSFDLREHSNKNPIFKINLISLLGGTVSSLVKSMFYNIEQM